MTAFKYKLYLWPFIALFLAGISLRFVRSCEIGVSGDDAAFYWQMAFEWMQGNEILSEHFRPFIYWLNAKIMYLTGPNDWILRVFNGIWDSLTACLMIYCGWLLRKNIFLGLTSAISYLFLYYPLIVARSELVHSSSTFFIMLSLTSLLIWLTNKKSHWIFISGLFQGAAWLIHPDLAVLGASATTIIVYKNLKTENTNTWMKISSDFLIYVLGYFLIFFFFMWDLGFSDLMENFFVNFKTQSKSLQASFFWRFYHFSYIYLKETTGIFVMTLLGGSIILAFIKRLKKRLTSQDLALFLYPFLFLFFCALLFSQNIIPRLLLPLVPSIILFIFVQAYDFTNEWKKSLGAMVVLCLSILVANHESFKYPWIEEVTVYKKISQRFKPILKQDSKYLITPLSTLHIHSALSKNIYLNGAGVYLISTNYTSLEETIIKEKITHIWIADVLKDPRIFGHNLKLIYEERLNTLFGMKPSEYNRDKEILLITDLLKRKNAVLVDKSELGELYELK